MDADLFDRERWRGHVSERLERIETEIDKLWKWKDHHQTEADERMIHIAQRLTSLEVKVAGFAALGAAVGTVAAVIVEHTLKHIP